VDVFQEAEMLRKVPFFGGLDPSKLKLLAFTSRAVRFAAGEIVVLKGDPAESAYVVLEGEVEVLGGKGESEFVIHVLGRHELIGEMGIITGTPRGATVRARTSVLALKVSGDLFLRLVTDYPACALHVMRELCQRVHKGNMSVAAARREIDALKQELGQAQSVADSAASVD